jgi:hypothetical protein
MKVRICWRTVAVGAALALAWSAGPFAQSKGKVASGPTPIRVDGGVIKGYIDYMASDDKEGRQSLTPGYEKVAEWAAGKFKEWGLKPAGDKGTFLQDVPVTGRGSGQPWTTGVPALAVDGRTFYLRDSDFTLSSSSTPATSVDAEIVFVGYGISAPAKGLDEYGGTDVKGKIVLAFKGSPKDAPAARGMFGATVDAPKDNEAWTDESKDAAKIKTAYDKGAAAIVLFAPQKLSPSPMPPQQLSQAQVAAMMAGRQAAPEPYARPYLVLSDVSERVFRHVMFRSPQESSRGFVARMDRWRRDIRDGKPHSVATGVKGQLTGYKTTVFFSEKAKNNISHNVIGKVDGTDPKLKAQVIVVGGHLDHVGINSDRSPFEAGVIMNGADDNASGAATVMEMARLVAANAGTIKPKRTIYFALWAAEEMGLIGSEYWSKHPTDGVAMDNVVANFNNDMVGLGDRIGAPGGLNFPAIWDVIMKNQEPDVVKNLETSTSGPGGSDYSAFIEQGIEAVALMTAGGIGHPDYHDAGDDPAKIDPEMLRKNGQFVVQGIINVANETQVNLLVPDRLHLYNGMRLTPLNLAGAGGGMGNVVIVGPSGVIQSGGPQGPRFGLSLDVTALNGNTALIDVAAKLLSIGRVEVFNPDGAWFVATGLTERGKAALKEFEGAGIVLQFHNPPPRLLDDLLDNAKKGFIVSNVGPTPHADLAKRLVEKNVVVAVEFDAGAPQAVATRLIELKKALGASGNVVLTTTERAIRSPMGDTPPSARQKVVDAAKQQMYLALVKAGWTKDEIYSMVGVTPTKPGQMPSMPGAGAPRLGGNLAKLTL